jgi:hypothetical protein
MISVCGNIRRRLVLWLLGLFLVAQVAGVVPLISVHLQHVIASEQDIAEDSASIDVSDHVRHHHLHHGSGHHDHCATDPNDQCCTLHHHLAGVLPHAAGGTANGFPIALIIPLPSRASVPADPSPIERPPKLLLSI